jgi:NADPH:quinone reductase-like Zn-dependent oxidoreductase
MKALFIRRHGTLEQLEFGDLPTPTPTGNAVRVATRAAALNHLDLFVLGGLAGVELPMPHVLGSDGAGVVDAVGPQVTRFHAGDRVMLNPLLWCGACEFCVQGEHSLCVKVGILGEHRAGTYSEYFLAPECNLEPVPEGIGFEQAAAFSLVFQTAWRMLISRGRLRVGEDVLIHGVGSGVSTAALEIARYAGARVFVTSSSDEKLERARSLGADFTYNYAREDVVAEVLRETQKRGVDLVVDTVGAATWGQSLRAARRGGRVVTCGATTGPNPPAEIHMVFWKQLEIIGSTMSNQCEYREVVRLLGAGKLTPVVDRVFPLERGREALTYLQEGKQFGKVVLAV